MGKVAMIAHIDHGKTSVAAMVARILADRPIVAAQQVANLRDDQMHCPECGDIAESESVDVGVGLYVRGNYECRCGWEYEADGRMNVASYSDYFVEPA